ncbi:hypothetical protein STAQ_15560 [Allostella sp. ATCC 35155]|nr:hypothetical protein STAQ_15560 [Stella sp. ATCC 35155]
MRRAVPIVMLALPLAACGSSGPVPSETTVYQCALGRAFAVTVRPKDPTVVIDSGRNRLILSRPDAGEDGKEQPRQAAAGEGQFTNGAVTLTLSGEDAMVENLPGGPYQNCRAAGPAEKTGAGIPPIKVD